MAGFKSYKGFYVVENPKKCLNQEGRIFFRSKLEYQVIKKLDLGDDYKKWGYELIKIPYVDPLKGKKRFYIIDIVVITHEGKKELWEIKYLSIAKSKFDGRKNAMINEEIIRNKAKWRAAKEFCKNNGYIFKVVGI